MTSKSSFFKLCGENLRHHTALTVVTLFCFLMQILTFILRIQNALSSTQTQRSVMQNSINALTEPTFGYALFAMILAVILAFDGFKFLHSKKQMDFYGSLPIRRSTLFQVISLDSILTFFIPLVITTLIEIIITAAVGYCSGKVVGNLLFTLLCMTSSFLVTWVTAVLAIVMTGHSFIALLGFGVFASYAPLILRYIIPVYAGTFFDTYTFSDSTGGILNYFSPASLSYKLTTDSQNWKFSAHGSYFWASVAMILIVGIIAYVLYVRRPAESAERAMTFQKINPVIRFLIVIPMALYSGIYMSQLSLTGSKAWLFIGILLGAFIFHGIVECIYQFDIRGLTSHKKQLGAAMIFCFVFTALFMADVFGYDTYLPKKDDLKSITLSMDMFTMNEYDYWGKTPDGITGEHMEQALELIQDIMDKNQDLHTENSSFLGISADQSDTDSSYDTLNVSYKFTDGSVKKRVYTFRTEEEKELIDQLFATEDLKNDIYSLYTADQSKITQIDWDNNIDYTSLRFTKEEQEAFFKIYLKELTALTYTDMQNTCPISEFIVSYKPANTYGSMEETYYIYPSFQNTIAFLKEKEVPADTTLADYEITQLELIVYDEDYEKMTTYLIRDAAVIDSVKDELILAGLSSFSGTNYDDHYEITATIKNNGMNETVYLSTDTKTGERLVQAAKNSD